MNDKQDVRWEQRFSSFDKAFLRLKDSLMIEETSELERNGIVKRFEFTLEQGWKTLKDFMQNEGLTFPSTPKATIRQAQQSGFINNAQDLIDALELRNELSHDYDEEKFQNGEEAIRKKYFSAIQKLHSILADQLRKKQLGLF